MQAHIISFDMSFSSARREEEENIYFPDQKKWTIRPYGTLTHNSEDKRSKEEKPVYSLLFDFFFTFP